MQEDQKPSFYPSEEEFSFKLLLQKRKEDLIYIWKFKKSIISVAIAGGFIGLFVAWFWPVTYTAKLTFVVEESKSGGGSLVSALAGSIGFDMSSLGGTSGVLAGDNVQELLKSQKIIRNTLLTPYSESKSDYSLADKYAESNNLKKKWADKYTGGKPINFPIRNRKYTRLQDSLFQVIITRITEKELNISKPDKKLIFFQASATMRDEKLAALFTTRLIKEATDFYIQTKTKMLRTNISRLQTRADSLTRLLNRKTYSSSAANAMLDVNPAYSSSNASAEVQQRDKVVLSTIYSEVIKNLEASRTMLIQETPTIQVVDEPEFPLKKNKLKYEVSFVLFMAIAAIGYSLFLLVFKKE